MPWSNQAHALQLLSLCSRAWEPQLLKSMCPRAGASQQRSHCSEKPCTAEALQPEDSSRSLQLEKNPYSNKDSAAIMKE